MKLGEVYLKYSAPDGGGDKGTAHTYLDIYESEISKTSDVNLLEIGVWEGHSIAMWREYLDNSLVIGVDIDLSKVIFDLPALIKADATHPIPDLMGLEFDYIIDDGSHRVDHQIQSLAWLFGRLKSGGKYFIEDIVSDQALGQITAYLQGIGAQFRIYDHRHIKNRYDDLMVVAYR